jgi:hypothetical protein
MPPSFFQKVANLLSGGPWRLELQSGQAGFALAAYRGQKSVPFAQFLDNQPSFRPLAALVSAGDVPVVSFPVLAQVRRQLKDTPAGDVQIKLAPEAEAFEVISPPPGFRVSYCWSAERQQFEREISDGAGFLGDGWYATSTRAWRVDGTQPGDDAWLAKSVVASQNALGFLRQVVPGWTARGLPYVCQSLFDEQPALSVVVRHVDAERVDIVTTWCAAPAAIVDIPSLPGFVHIDGSFQPGLAPSALANPVLRTSGTVRLSGLDIPHFVCDDWPKLQPWASGQIADIARFHRLLMGPASLSLVIRPDNSKGIGKAAGQVMFECSGVRENAEAVSRQFDSGADYARIGNGWVPRSVVQQAGIGPLGRLSDGTSLAGLATPGLKPAEILARGSARLAGPWQKVEFPDLQLPDGATPAETATRHLAFLTDWDIPGGIIGSIQDYQGAIRDYLVGLRSMHASLRILVVGTKKALDSLDGGWQQMKPLRFDGGRHDPQVQVLPTGLTLGSAKALESVPSLISTNWQVVILLEADGLIKTPNSALYANLVRCSRSLTLGLFGGRDFLSKTSARAALAQVFKEDADIVWRYGLRDPCEPAPALPAPTNFVPRQLPAVGTRPAEIAVGRSQDTPAAMPIPVKGTIIQTAPASRASQPSVITNSAGVRVEVRVVRSADEFLSLAQKLVNQRESRAHFVPFQCYWPTYTSMTEQQLRWYLFWRGQVRDAKYPNTDLSYIFLHVYELINNVGVRNADDGYERLRNLWLGYRGQYPKLDRYLVDWLADYAIVNHCHASPLRSYVDALREGSEVGQPDLAMAASLDQPPDQWPLSLIEALSAYRVRRSKFYLEGHQADIEQNVPQCLAAVDGRLKEKFASGLLDLFRPERTVTIDRQPYQSARYCGEAQKVSIGPIVPYSEHAPFGDFLANLLKHTENRLRERAGYSGRLRGITLEPEVQRVIDELILGPVSTTVAPPVVPLRPRVQIDLSRVQALTQESDQLREMLLVNGEDEGTEPPSAPAAPTAAPGSLPPAGPVRPEDTPAGLLTDLAPVYNILGRLEPGERSLLDLLLRSGWQINSHELAQALPGMLVESAIDHINGLAVLEIGDILIATENDLRIVADDYRDELAYLLSGNVPAIPRGHVKAGAFADLPAEWADFAGRLADPQLAALEAIANQADPRSTIREIAEANASMPGALIDAINDLAMQTIGDIIIDPAADPPCFEEEDLPFVKQLIAANL